MNVGVETLLTSALGLQVPWVDAHVKLDTAERRIDFEIGCQGSTLACPACSASVKPVHDRLRRSWRHLDFFQFKACLHRDVPRIACGRCGKTTQLPVPWARPGSGSTATFEVLALALWREMPVRQAASLLRCAGKQLWRRIEFYVGQAHAQESFADVQIVGIDETSVRRGQNYITVIQDPDAARLLFATEGCDHQTVVDFAADLKAHGGDPEKVRRAEMRDVAPAVRGALAATDRKTLKQLKCGVRRNPSGWSRKQTDAMHWLPHSSLTSARAWRLKMALRGVCAQARKHINPEQASNDLRACLGWTRRCRLEPLRKLATTIKERRDAVVRGMTDHRSNAFVDALNGMLQDAKRAARGFRTASHFISIAHLRMSKLANRPTHPFSPAAPK